LQAAQAWIDYNADSVRYLFAYQADEAKAWESEQMAERIVGFLRQRPEGATLTELTVDLFQRHPTKQPLGDVLDMMLADHRRYSMEMKLFPRADGRHGKKRRVYRLHDNRSEHCEHSNYLATARVTDEKPVANLCELSNSNTVVRVNIESDLSSQKFALTKNAETRVAVDEKLCSQSSQQNTCNDQPESTLTATIKPNIIEL
jgi:hypothetical protein